MPSAYIETRQTKAGVRYRVRYRIGGAESVPRLAGTFRTKREALERRAWVLGELAARRNPAVRDEHGRWTVPAMSEPERTETFAEAAKRWQASRVDVADGTKQLHRVALGRVLPTLGTKQVDRITTGDVAELVEALHGRGLKRETIRKSVTVLAQTLDFASVTPNPARDRVQVRLPREQAADLEPPTVDAVEAACWQLAIPYMLGVLVLDASGVRVGELEAATVGDLDEERGAWLIRASVSKTRRARWVDLPADLLAVVLGRLPAREDRNPAAPLFGVDVTGDRLRTAIGRACRDAGVPAFSPHALRHRRISLLHRQGESWAAIGERMGQRSKLVTADTYTHALIDSREVDRARLLVRLSDEDARTMHTPVHTSKRKQVD